MILVAANVLLLQQCMCTSVQLATNSTEFKAFVVCIVSSWLVDESRMTALLAN